MVLQSKISRNNLDLDQDNQVTDITDLSVVLLNLLKNVWKIMFETLRHYLDSKTELTDEDFEIIKNSFVPKKLRKRQYMLQEGDICRYIIFVEKGILRLYGLDNKGNENILQFAPEEWWVTDRESIEFQKPSRYNIDALEDSELLLITLQNQRELGVKVPAYAELEKQLISKSVIAHQKRIHAAISYSAEEKYSEYLETYPHIFQRVPQHMIASYLGMSPETLSRIRKKMSI